MTFILGGGNQTLGQIKASIESNTPVVIVQQSGEIPKCLALIYKKLEALVTRSCNHTADFTPREKTELQHLLKNCESCRCLFQTQNECDPDTAMTFIMKHRYLLTFMDLTNNTSADFINVIRAIYKPYNGMDCMELALQANTLSFLHTYFYRDVDPVFEERKGHIDVNLLVSLHRANLHHKAKLFHVTKNCSSLEDKSVLHLVGYIVFKLVGDKYSLLYNGDICALHNELHKDPLVQRWHMFLYSVLSDKVQFAEYFLSLTHCPLGAALFASKLYLGMEKCAKKVTENEKANSFKNSAQYFEDLALKLLDEIYQEDPTTAYISLTRDMPFKLGQSITPLSIAADCRAKAFMESECCQTYLQKVWTKNMYLGSNMKLLLLFLLLLPFVTLPLILFYINFEETKAPVQNLPIPPNRDNEIKKHSCAQHAWWKVKSFYTAPITKCTLSMISYMTFLGVLSYFFLSKLQPARSVWDICASEWLCYIWTFGFLVEEIAQLASVPHVRHSESQGLNHSVWPMFNRFSLKFYRLKLYLQDGTWNSFDLFMIFFYGIVTTTCRFTLSVQNFQMVRILYSVAIIFFYFRFLRYFHVLKVIGPRIIAIYEMMMELTMFLLILVVFIISFGVAFQGLLNPLQEPSWTVVTNILWRSYWPMFGEMNLEEEDIAGLGREIGNSSCLVAMESGGKVDLNCYSPAPIILLGIYLVISNILLLNLLIAIFGNTLNKIEYSSNRQWAFSQYGIVQEFYYKPILPAPLNILCHIFHMLKYAHHRVKQCRKRNSCLDAENSTDDHLRTNVTAMNEELVMAVEKKAFRALQHKKLTRV